MGTPRSRRSCSRSPSAPCSRRRSPAPATMQSTKLGPGLCETTGGGRFVDIPGFPGETIDRRLLTDIRWLRAALPDLRHRRLLADHVHAANGEHPLGLALDIVPDKEPGGTWNDIDRARGLGRARADRPAPAVPLGRLRRRRRPRPRPSPAPLLEPLGSTRPGRPARTVYTIRCPAPATYPAAAVEPAPEPPPPPHGSRRERQAAATAAAGAAVTEAAVRESGGGGVGGSGSGGIGSKAAARPAGGRDATASNLAER